MASYGTEAGVAALCKPYTTGSAFTTGTNPTLATVTGWLAQISSMMNVALASAGFATPITDADVTPALDGFVNALAADLVFAANARGRFYSERALEFGVSPIKAINQDVIAWVETNASGLAVMGASRSYPNRGVIVTSTVKNPQFSRPVYEDNSDTTGRDEIGTLIT